MSDMIPCDISRKIFLLLPAKSLIRFRAVCKAWQSIIDDPCFVRAYTRKQQSSNTTVLIRLDSTGTPYSPLYSVDLETLNPTNGIHHSIPATPLCLSRLPQFPVATCNGLMLIPPDPDTNEKNWEIWNPLTHERLELPQRGLPAAASSHSNVFRSGFGYDNATEDFKVVLVFRDSSENPVCRTHVYSLKRDTWKRIEDFPCGRYCNFRSGVFLSGSLHWISSNKVIVLDLGTEKYGQLKLPPLHIRNRPEMMIRQKELEVLGGRLILLDIGRDDWFFEHHDAWEMEEDGAWRRLFAMDDSKNSDIELNSRPIAYIMKNKMQVLLHGSNLGLFIFDIESYSGKSVVIHGPNEVLSAQAFHESIFRLHDNCGRVRGSVVPTKRRRIEEEKMKISHDTKLMFCVRDIASRYNSPYRCFDSNWHYLSNEDEYY